MIVLRLEIALDESGRQPGESSDPVSPGACLCERVRINIRSHDLDVVGIDQAPVLEQPDGDRIGFLTCRAGHRPDTQEVAGPFGESYPWQDVSAQCRELVAL